MVRVSGAAAAASSWSRRASTHVVRIVSSISSSHRDAFHPLPHRLRRKRRKISFVVTTFGMLVVFATLQWYLLSSMVIRKFETAVDFFGNQNDPFRTKCPIEVEMPKKETKDICFLTCIFGDSVENVDWPANVKWFDTYWCHTQFLLVTNLADLPAPGWTKIVSNSTAATNIPILDNATLTQQNIVLSRHAKFLAWEALPALVPQNCAAVVYMDGYLAPIRFQSWWMFVWALLTNPPWSPASPLFVGSWYKTQIPPPPKFQNLVRQVRYHNWGLSQVKQKYFDGLPMTTLLNNLVRDHKDTQEHVDSTLEWFRSQDSNGNKFQEIIPYYLNKYFGESILGRYSSEIPCGSFGLSKLTKIFSYLI